MSILKSKELNIMRLSRIHRSAITNIVFSIEQESADFSSEEPAGKYFRHWGPLVSITAPWFCWCSAEAVLDDLQGVRVIVSLIYSSPTPGTQNLDFFPPCIPHHVCNCISCSFHFIFLLLSKLLSILYNILHSTCIVFILWIYQDLHGHWTFKCITVFLLYYMLW